ncbi:MAG TPA: type II toxin-antitoxin system RelE/ParE family toxin [Xanthobacteraceae bacterium]|jgi:plasmid stabilization system protein ParE
MKVRYRRRAQLDIENIHEYIERQNPRAAAEIVARIRYAAERLGTWPYMGHAGRAKGTHEWVVVGSPYVIAYEVDPAADEVVIIAVFHGARRRDEEW